MKRAILATVAGAILLAAAGYGAWTYASGYVVDCEPADRLIMDYARLPGEQLDDYFAKLHFAEGVPAKTNGQHSPWIVAYVGLLNLQRYCETGDDGRLQAAIVQRDWLAENTEISNEDLRIRRFPYRFPNPPYASEPGWSSAMSQSAGTLLMQLIQPRFDPLDQDKLDGLVRASLHSVSEGGTYSAFGDDLIFWEEVSTHERPSLIINGAQVATFYYDLVIDQIQDETAKETLAGLNQKAVRALLDVQDDMMLSSGLIRYDLTLDPVNTRERSHYAYRIAVSWLKWVGTEEAGRILDQLTSHERFADAGV